MKKKFKRAIQLITGFHRIHHIHFSYGYKIPFVNIGFFKVIGFRKLKGRGMDYQNCTITGVY